MNKRLTNDYFATELLEKLDSQDPIDAAFEAQDVSRQVGFDFTTVDQVLKRALDEVRETREAHQDFADAPNGITRAHLGDEISDLVFSAINLGRHKKLTPKEFPPLMTGEESTEVSVEDILEKAANAMYATAKADTQVKAIQGVSDIFRAASYLAAKLEFDLVDLTRQNIFKYLTRCAAIEKLASDESRTWHDLAEKNEITEYWKAVKQLP